MKTSYFPAGEETPVLKTLFENKLRAESAGSEIPRLLSPRSCQSTQCLINNMFLERALIRDEK